MKIETKYSCGDNVFTIESRQEQRSTTCSFCGGERYIFGKDDERKLCPECYGRPQYEYLPRKYMVGISQCTVGKVKFEFTDSKGIEGEVFDNYKAQSKTEENYMLVETGIGSGRVWPVNFLHSTIEEAQAECDKLNVEQKEKAQ